MKSVILQFTVMLALFVSPVLSAQTASVVLESSMLVKGGIHQFVSEKDRLYLAYIDMDNRVHFGIAEEQPPSLKDDRIIYQYEKLDTVLDLEYQRIDGTNYVLYAEKFSYEIILNQFDDRFENKKQWIIGQTRNPFYTYIDAGRNLAVVYVDEKTSKIIHKTVDRRKDKIRTVVGADRVRLFNCFYNPDNRVLMGLWKEEDVKSVYLSLMNEDLKGLLPMIELKFNQRTSLPAAAVLDDRYILVFQNDFKNRYLISPFQEDIRNRYPADLSESFSFFTPRQMVWKSGALYLLLDKMDSSGAGSEPLSIINAAVLAPDMTVRKIFQIKGHVGTVSQYQITALDKGVMVSFCNQTGTEKTIRIVFINPDPLADF